MVTQFKAQSAAAFTLRNKEKQEYDDPTITKVDSPSIQRVKDQIRQSEWYKKPRS